jgi:hypothetical protein
VDVISPSVRAQLFYQDLYHAAAASPIEVDPAVAMRLKEIADRAPDWIKKAEARITFSYFSLLAGDIDLAEKFTINTSGEVLTTQFEAYELILRSYIAARRDQFDRSAEMLDTALEPIKRFHHQFASESAGQLPAIIEETTKRRRTPNSLSEGSGTLKHNQSGKLVTPDQKIIYAGQGFAGTGYRRVLLSPVFCERIDKLLSILGK